jgi:hypothetical protein
LLEEFGGPFLTKADAEDYIKGKYKTMFLDNVSEWTAGLTPSAFNNFMLKFDIDSFSNNAEAIQELIDKINSFSPDVYSFIKVE